MKLKDSNTRIETTGVELAGNHRARLRFFLLLVVDARTRSAFKRITGSLRARVDPRVKQRGTEVAKGMFVFDLVLLI